MRSIYFALIGIVLYAVQNAIIDVRLKQYPTTSLLLAWYVVLLPLAIGLYVYQKYAGGSTIMPVGSDVWFMIAVAVLFFIADFFYIGAFTSGGNVVTITILLVLMPVVAALTKFLWVREVPTTYHLIGFLCAFMAVVCIAMGDRSKPVDNSAKQVDQSVLTQ